MLSTVLSCWFSLLQTGTKWLAESGKQHLGSHCQPPVVADCLTGGCCKGAGVCGSKTPDSVLCRWAERELGDTLVPQGPLPLRAEGELMDVKGATD